MNSDFLRLCISVLGRFLPLLLICLIGSELLAQIPSIDSFNQTWIDAHTRHNGWQGVTNFVLVSCLLASLGAPRQFIAFLSGYAFGFTEGVIYSTFAITLSCLLTTLVSRFYAKPVVMHFFPNKVMDLNRFLTNQVFLKTMIVRLLPVGNNLITNITAGVSTIKIWPFVMGSMFGYVPQMAIFALMGKGVVVQSYWKIILSVVILAISSLLSLYVYKKFKADKYLNTSVNPQSSLHLSPSNGHKQ
ncbi:MAG: VTT domain-containing protein [Aliiglaciecola sp.]|uniref:TVP38/TMEM64 family protein n=1 Tax=Aliiglaciecola sp. TaxID=1872441 RepID=UPI00329740A3